MQMNTSLIIAALALGPMAVAASVNFQSSERQTSLLELYTSEGCSSCPPAEAWLSKLGNDPGLWSGFVPVAFHVDYWNNLGWRDRLSSEAYSERQRRYAHAWSTDEIYTPELVLNGREWHNWFGFRGAPAASGARIGVLSVHSENLKIWHCEFTPLTGVRKDYEVTAAVLVSGLGSDVAAGENAGRHLNHDFAVLSLITRPLTSGTNAWTGSFIVDARPKGIRGRLALAVWVTGAGELEPLQATGGWMPGDEAGNKVQKAD
jgi:hypothetical protein